LQPYSLRPRDTCLRLLNSPTAHQLLKTNGNGDQNQITHSNPFLHYYSNPPPPIPLSRCHRQSRSRLQSSSNGAPISLTTSPSQRGHLSDVSLISQSQLRRLWSCSLSHLKVSAEARLVAGATRAGHALLDLLHVPRLLVAVSKWSAKDECERVRGGLCISAQ